MRLWEELRACVQPPLPHKPEVQNLCVLSPSGNLEPFAEKSNKIARNRADWGKIRVQTLEIKQPGRGLGERDEG